MDSAVSALIDAALREDLGPGDWTTRWTVPEALGATARVTAKAPGVAAGLEVAREVFLHVAPDAAVSLRVSDGAPLAPGDVLLEVSGSARGILTAERTALNFLGRLCGIATLTRRYVDAVVGTGARILDTRKTTPGMRLLEKQAVRAGGGSNHRFGLHDMVLIKENHIAAAGGIRAALAAVRQQNGRDLPVEIETATLAQVDEVLEIGGVDRILFDNMKRRQLRQAVERVRASEDPRPETEASGGISLDTVRDIAATGVDFVSVGALTHSAPALDLSLLLHTDAT